MLERFFNYLKGYVKIRICGNSPERFLNLCSYHQIRIWGLQPKNHTYEMYVTIEGFKKLHGIARKTHTKIKIIEKSGLPFWLFRYKRRKLFFLGMLAAVILIFQYSNYIWDIQFEGNDKWTDPVLMEFLEKLGVAPGMRKEVLDCSKIATQIRREYNDIVWVSVSIEGSCMQIRIKENEDALLQENGESQDSEVVQLKSDSEYKNAKDIIASEDGVITAMITRNGIPQVQIGDEVKAGDLLVSGRIEVKNDSAEVIGYQYCEADADVLADTEEYYKNIIERTYKYKEYIEKEERRKWYVIFGSYRLAIGTNENNSEYKKEIFQLEQQIKFGDNFYLPFSCGMITLKSYKEVEQKYTKEEIQELLTNNFLIFLDELEKKGIQIRQNSVKINCYDNYASAEGILYLNKSIVQTADTEILEIERNELNEFSRTVN